MQQRLRAEIDFQLRHVHRLADLFSLPRYQSVDQTMVDGILDTTDKLAEDWFAPCAAELDANEPVLSGDTVVVPDALKQALDAYVETGLMGATFDEADGGLQLPITLGNAAATILSAANLSAHAYPFLTIAAARLQASYGSEAQKATYMTRMIEGRYFGTMCLSEPHAGSSLAEIRTQAQPQPDGTYLIKGSKMWISGADHELSENIVHHVLARLPDAPAGVKGISLFLVPKHRVSEDGARHARNDVTVSSLNHKMGYRGTVNAALNFGDRGDCIGTLVGEPHKGLAYMFQMMNEARIGVGLGAAALGLAGFYTSLDYAQDRKQGKALGETRGDAPQVPIIEHADVRAMLLKQKAYSEGALSLLIYCSMLVDRQMADPVQDHSAAEELLGLLTPIAKTYPSEYCLEANKLAIQVLGGAGYTRDFPLERMYRDNRLNPIHEGTTGIQGLDLLARKVLSQGPAALDPLWRVISATEEAATEYQSLAFWAAELKTVRAELDRVTEVLAQRFAQGDLEAALSHSSVYQDALCQIVIAWIWLDQARVVTIDGAQPSPELSPEYAEGKLAACRFFFAVELPRLRWLLPLLDGTSYQALDIPASAF